ncbi:hypothetical protein niasHT_033937 [Heterodera trifolii]|uniref:Uncharacterized protein n=1 Tax=Heterodera trifolii TaxID=157864 RepID=A0ABD2HWN7_9BILA
MLNGKTTRIRGNAILTIFASAAAIVFSFIWPILLMRPVFVTFPVTQTPACTGLPVANERIASAAAADAMVHIVWYSEKEQKLNKSAAAAAAALGFLSLANGMPVQQGICVTGQVTKRDES